MTTSNFSTDVAPSLNEHNHGQTQAANRLPRLIRLDEVIAQVGMSRSSLYAAIDRGEFPKQLKIGARSVAWLESDVQAWIRQRVQASRGAAELRPSAPPVQDAREVPGQRAHRVRAAARGYKQ
jgi:prophage regulatory protein